MAPPTDPDAARRGRRVYWLGFVLVLVVLVVAGWTARMFGYFGQPLAWRFTARWAALVAAVLVLLALVLTHWAVRLSPGTPERPSAAELAGLGDAGRAARIRDFRRSGVKGLVMGADGRASTSLVQVTLWTVALGYALLMLLLLGRSPNCPVAAPHGGSCPGTPMTGRPFVEALGPDFRWEYLLLLGWPVAVAVATRRQVLRALDGIDRDTGAARDPALPAAGSPEAIGADPRAQVKTPPTGTGAIGVLAGLRDVVGDDRGRGALLDAQYFAFTLVAVGYFVLQVTAHPGDGLPRVPAALLVLMGISGAAYLSGKVLDPVGNRGERGRPPPAMPEPSGAAAPAPAADVTELTVAIPLASPEETAVIRVPPPRPGDDPTRPIKR